MPSTSVHLPIEVRVDRRSPVPLYHQVARQLEAAIASGELPAGTRLDNEISLAEHLEISRPTMRRAIEELVGKGLLVRKRGVGTQVVHAGVRRELALTSLHEDLDATGQRPTTRTLLNRIEDASAEVAAALGVEEGEPVLHLERVRSANGAPLAVLRNWMPASVLTPSDDDLAAHGLYDLIRARGITLRVARQRIGARAASAAESADLDLPADAPVLVMQRTAYDDAGRAIEFGDHCYRPTDYLFEVTLVDR